MIIMFPNFFFFIQFLYNSKLKLNLKFQTFQRCSIHAELEFNSIFFFFTQPIIQIKFKILYASTNSVTGLEFEFRSRDQELRIKFKIPNVPSNSSFTRFKLQIKFKISNVTMILVSIFPIQFLNRLLDSRSNMTGDEDQISSCPTPLPHSLQLENLVLTREIQVTIKRVEVKRDNVSGINWAENARRVKMADNLFCLAVW